MENEIVMAPGNIGKIKEAETIAKLLEGKK